MRSSTPPEATPNPEARSARRAAARPSLSVSVFALLLCGALAWAGCSDDGAEADADSGQDAAGGQGDADVADGVDGGQDDAGVADGVDDASDASDGEDDAGANPGTPLALPGMSAEASAWVDAFGVLHASCETDADCATILGYFHARDRFAQMDLRRRLTTGRIGTFVTSAVHDIAVSIDGASRAQFTTRDGRPIEDVLVESATPETLAVLEGYSNGVNAWLDDVANGRNGATYAAEFGFALVSVEEIPRWEPSDCVATVVALVDSLTNSADADIARGLQYAAAGDAAGDLFRPRAGSTSVILPDFVGPGSNKERSAERVPATAVDAALLRRAAPALEQALAAVQGRRIDMPDAEGARGSNNWVVSPELSASGNALLTNDPHLGMSNPSIWYLAHLDAKTNGTGTWHAAGMTFAGMPWVVIGQNEDLAWGATNSNFDQSDVYIETLTEDGEGVLFDGEEVPFLRRTFTIELAGAEPRDVEALYVEHHGVVLSVDEEAGTAISHRWTGNDLDTDVNFLTEIMAAADIDEAQDAIRNVTSIGQNWVVATRDGDIGWFPFNRVPTRAWHSLDTPAWLPLPGDGSAEWGEYYALEDLPQALNPPQGYLATANNDMVGAFVDGDQTNEDWSTYQNVVAIGLRHERIVQLLEATDAHDTATMLDAVGDVYSLLGERLAPFFAEAAQRATLTEDAQAVVDAMAAWDFACPTGIDGVDPEGPLSSDAEELAAARGCLAFHAAYYMARQTTFADEFEAEGWSSFPSRASFYLMLLRPEVLDAPDAWWDDVTTTDVVETRDDALVAALEEAGALLRGLLGAPEGWIWGRVHTLTLRADLFDSLGIDIYNHGPFANDGGDYTVDVANVSGSPASGEFFHNAGASMRMVCEAGDPAVSCLVQLPGGQDHHRPENAPDNANYDDLLQRWLRNEPIELLFDTSAVAPVAAETWQVTPQ